MDGTIIEIAITIFILLMLIAQLISIKLRVPYTLVLVLMGIVTTALSVLILGKYSIFGILQNSVQEIQLIYDQLVNTGLFVGLVVPPLIFEAMIHVKRKELKEVLKPALILATLGVLVSVAVISIVVWKLSGLPLMVALLFAIIISPTDTITVLEVFRRINAPAQLSALMDVEAAFNDATAIVLFSIVISSIGIGQTSLFGGIETFVYDFIGGIIIGISVAFVAGLVHSALDDKIAETTLTIAAVYGSYVLATGLGASGLIAVAIVGLYFGNSTMDLSLSKEVRLSIISFWEIAAFVGNAIAFMLIGFDTNLRAFFKVGYTILIAYVATVIARAAAVYPTFNILNRFKRKIPRIWENIAVLGGVRGALSIALLATLTSSGVVSQSEMEVVAAMVLGVVFISIMVQVPMLSSYAKKRFAKTIHIAK